MTSAGPAISLSPVPPLNFSHCAGGNAGGGPHRQVPGRSPEEQDSFSLSGHSFSKKTPKPHRRRPGRGAPEGGEESQCHERCCFEDYFKLGEVDVKCRQCYEFVVTTCCPKISRPFERCKLQYEQKYIYGLQSLPPVQDLLEGHMRYSLIQATPENMAAKLTAYGHYGSKDVLFHLLKELNPNKETFRLQMFDEVNFIPFDKSTLTFNNAPYVLETWIQKYEVARNFASHVEPQKMVAIVQRIVDAVRNSNWRARSSFPIWITTINFLRWEFVICLLIRMLRCLQSRS
eukprot:2969067-Amphidinium_carterae.2